MKNTILSRILAMAMILFSAGIYSNAQTPDSKVCACFPAPVSSTFMNGTKALYGTIGIMLSNDLEIKPKQAQPVKFVIPALASKSGCKSWYSIYVADANNNKVFESAGAGNEISYTFPDCNKTYYVTLMAYSKSAQGGDGNCSRRIRIVVKPQCNTTVCNCFMSKTKTSATSGDLNISGRLECLSPTTTQRRYVLKFDIVNKTDCILNVTSISTLGQVVEVPAYNTAPKAQTRGISLGLSTPVSQPFPTASKVSILVKYTLNGQKCAVTMDLPYTACPN